MTHSAFAEGYNLIKDMPGSEFLTALRMLAGRQVMVKKLTAFKERHKAKQSEPIAVLLARAAEGGDQEAISLLAAGALGLKTNRACQQSGGVATFGQSTAGTKDHQSQSQPRSLRANIRFEKIPGGRHDLAHPAEGFRVANPLEACPYDRPAAEGP
jgi:hypothetical protein